MPGVPEYYPPFLPKGRDLILQQLQMGGSWQTYLISYQRKQLHAGGMEGSFKLFRGGISQ